MRNRLLVLASLSALCCFGLLTGCSGNKADEGTDLKTTAPINNNAPEAKTAGAAPVDPSIPPPGGRRKGAR
jgi:hypothetical protein